MQSETGQYRYIFRILSTGFTRYTLDLENEREEERWQIYFGLSNRNHVVGISWGPMTLAGTGLGDWNIKSSMFICSVY